MMKNGDEPLKLEPNQTRGSTEVYGPSLLSGSSFKRVANEPIRYRYSSTLNVGSANNCWATGTACFRKSSQPNISPVAPAGLPVVWPKTLFGAALSAITAAKVASDPRRK